MGIPDKVRDDAEEMFGNYNIEFVDLQKRPPGKIFIPLASSQKQKDKELSDLSTKIEENLHLFDNRLNVTAVQASYKVVDSKEQPEVCVAVFVLGKARVPAGESDIKEIRKIKNEDNKCVFKDDEFDVLEGYYQPAIDASQASYVSPLQSGFGIGVEGINGAGTLGGFLEDENGKHYILSCQHVLCPRGAKSKVILQPAQSDYKTMLCEAQENLERVLKSKNIPGSDGLNLTQEEVDAFNETRPHVMRRIQRKEREARQRLEVFEREEPRAIGKYVLGLQDNVHMLLDDKTFTIFVDAAIAALDKTEKTYLRSMSHVYVSLYGFEERENTAMPIGKSVEWEDFVELRKKDTELSFNKSGRTTGFTDKGVIKYLDTNLFVNIPGAPEDTPLINPKFSHVPYRFCVDCRLSDANLEQIDDYTKTHVCAKCKKQLTKDDQVSTFWACNCFVIRKSKKPFCDRGDSGSLVFDNGGNAWGLLHGTFECQSINEVLGLASPLCVTLEVLGEKLGKKLKLWKKT